MLEPTNYLLRGIIKFFSSSVTLMKSVPFVLVFVQPTLYFFNGYEGWWLKCSHNKSNSSQFGGVVAKVLGHPTFHCFHPQADSVYKSQCKCVMPIFAFFLCLITPIYKGQKSNRSITKRFLRRGAFQSARKFFKILNF